MNELTKRIIMTVLGVSICGLSVGLFSYSSMGLDPFQVFAHGTWSLFPLGYGTYYMILNAKGLISLLGPAQEASLLIRSISLLLGVVIMCFSAALYFTADMGVSTYDAIAITLDERKAIRFGSRPPVPFKYIRIATDLICVTIGGLLGAAIGVGTIISAFFMGPLISFFRKTVAEPMRYGKRMSYGKRL